MNILFILKRYPGFGGIEMVTKLLSEEFCKRPKFHVSVFSTAVQNNPVQLLSLPNWELIVSTTNKNEQLKQLDEILHQRTFDIVIYQDSYSPEEYLIEHIAKHHIKIIVCEHNTPNALLIGYRMAYKEIKLTSLYSILHKSRRYIRYHQERWKAKYHHRKMLHLADKYVLLSDQFRKILQCEYQIDINDKKILSIGNPVSLPIGNVKPKKKEALFVGRLTGQKGTAFLVQIWCEIAQRHRDWTLYIVGDGEDKASMMKAFKDADVHNVVFEGFHSDVLNYYQRASCLLFTSLYEGWGLVLLEAMSQGCIPISFKSYDSVYDIIDDTKNGYLVDAFDVIAYINTLEHFMLTSEEQQIEMRLNALAKARKFTPSAIINKWIELLNSIQ